MANPKLVLINLGVSSGVDSCLCNLVPLGVGLCFGLFGLD